MDDFLLFVHVLAAFFLMITVVMYSAYALGAPATRPALSLAGWLWDIGGIGTLVFGVWIALDRPEYGIFDGWILGALVLWIAATATGMRARVAIAGPPGGEMPAVPDRSLAAAHWLRVAVTLAILVLMVWKPGA